MCNTQKWWDNYRLMTPVGRFVSDLALKAVHTGQTLNFQDFSQNLVVSGHPTNGAKRWWKRYKELVAFYRDDENPLVCRD